MNELHQMNELNKDFAKAIRSLVDIVAAQQGLLQGLYRAHGALLDALTGSEPQSRPAIDPAAAERARREIDELRHMFGEEG